MPCGHEFCGACLKHWFEQTREDALDQGSPVQLRCPTCRTNVTGQPVRYVVYIYLASTMLIWRSSSYLVESLAASVTRIRNGPSDPSVPEQVHSDDEFWAELFPPEASTSIGGQSSRDQSFASSILGSFTDALQREVRDSSIVFPSPARDEALVDGPGGYRLPATSAVQTSRGSRMFNIRFLPHPQAAYEGLRFERNRPPSSRIYSSSNKP